MVSYFILYLGHLGIELRISSSYLNLPSILAGSLWHHACGKVPPTAKLEGVKVWVLYSTSIITLGGVSPDWWMELGVQADTTLAGTEGSASWLSGLHWLQDCRSYEVGEVVTIAEGENADFVLDLFCHHLRREEEGLLVSLESLCVLHGHCWHRGCSHYHWTVLPLPDLFRQYHWSGGELGLLIAWWIWKSRLRIWPLHLCQKLIDPRAPEWLSP